jgi:putative redox protein
MSSHQTRVRLNEGRAFTGELNGREIPIGAAPPDGGERKGVSPKGLTLTSLCGCTAIDVIDILRKMRQDVTDLVVEARADETDEHPRIFREILLTYRVKGKNLSRERVEHAVELSQEQYCGVSAMLKATVPIKTEIVIEEA